MDMKRRSFLRNSLFGLGGVSVVAGMNEATAAPASVWQKYPFSTDPVGRVKLTPQIETSRIGLGTGMAGYNHSSSLTRMDRSKAEGIIRHCYDSGVRFYDCADLYGTHEIISSTLKDKPRDSYTLSSKVWPHGGLNKDFPPCDVVVKRFLKELNAEYLDLVQIHCMSNGNWEEEFKRYEEELEKCKEQGLIRGHGVSCHTLDAIQVAAKSPFVDAFHLPLNTKGARMGGSFEDTVEAGQEAQKNGKGIICMKLIGEGQLHDYEERKASIDKVVRSGIVDVYIVGFEECSQVDELIDNIGNSLKAIEAEQKA